MQNRRPVPIPSAGMAEAWPFTLHHNIGQPSLKSRKLLYSPCWSRHIARNGAIRKFLSIVAQTAFRAVDRVIIRYRLHEGYQYARCMRGPGLPVLLFHRASSQPAHYDLFLLNFSRRTMDKNKGLDTRFLRNSLFGSRRSLGSHSKPRFRIQAGALSLVLA